MSVNSISHSDARNALNTLLHEIEKEKHIFSFRTIIKLITADGLANNL